MERRRVAIAYIGGGSRHWAMHLMTDLALEPALEGTLRLYDVDLPAAAHNASIGEALFSHPDAQGRFEVRAVATPGEALAGADFVVVSIEPGPIEARFADLVIPARYGILQTVGDTTGPGGILRALRAIPVMADYARLIMDICPEAHVINYTNPMTLCTAALYTAAPGIRAHGCCHEIFDTQRRLAALAAAERGEPVPHRREIELDFAGVNHFTMATTVRWRDRDLMPLVAEYARKMDPAADRTAIALDRRAKEEWFECDGAVAFDLLQRFGVLGAAGDRHLAEFVPWYLHDEATILRHGVPPTPYEWRVREWTGPRPTVQSVRERPLEPSREEGVEQIKALMGLGDLITNLNLPNRGQWSQAPPGTVVETRALLYAGGARPLSAPDLPNAAASLQRRIIDEQIIVLEAAQRRDRHLVLEALLLDPLVRLPVPRVEHMVEEMLAYTAPWLPGWDSTATAVRGD